jgi:predicted DNA-binding ribbon-helix-helix protein
MALGAPQILRDAESPQLGGTTLVSRNVTVAGHRTSVRLEPMMWDALREVCLREQSSASALVTIIAQEQSASSLTSAIRVYLLAYFRAAATDAGHDAARHGVVPRRWRGVYAPQPPQSPV